MYVIIGSEGETDDDNERFNKIMENVLKHKKKLTKPGIQTIDIDKDGLGIDVDVLFMYANILENGYKNFELSNQYYDKIIGLCEYRADSKDFIDEYRCKYGFSLYKQQKFPEAIEQFRIILSNHDAFLLEQTRNNYIPNRVGSTSEHVIYEDQEMNRDLEKKLPKRFSHVFASLYLGVIHTELLDFDKAKEYFEMSMKYRLTHLLKKNGSMQIMILNEYILYLIKINELKKASYYWTQSFRLDRQLSKNDYTSDMIHNIDIDIIGAYLLSQTGNYKRSQKMFDNIIHFIDNNVKDEHINKYGYQNPFYYYGLHLLNIKDYKNAKNYFIKAYNINPEFPELSYQLGYTLAILGENNDAKYYLSNALNLNFDTIYPKYFNNSDVFKPLGLLDIPQEKQQLLLEI